MPINSGYSFYEYAGDGVTTRFPVQFSLGELKRAYVTCRVDNEVDGEGAPLYRELADVPGDPGMIEVLGAVPGVGVPIVFRRIVPKELLLHLYANGSILDYPSLDESHLQLMMALHEVLDGYGLTNVFTDINMNGYKLTNIYSDPNDPNSMATVAFLGTYRQDALGAAIAAADSALEALGYSNTAFGHANTAAAQVVLCQDQVQLAVNQVLLAEGHADAAALSALAADGFSDNAEQSALDAIAAVNSAAFTNLPIGTLVWHTGTTAFPGSIVADGELRSRAAFPDLWAFAQASGNISVDDASWDEGKYSPGDGSTTFRVPKVDDRFIRGKSGTRAVGLVEEDAFQGHWHDLWGRLTSVASGSTTTTPGSITNVYLNNNSVRDPVTDGINGIPSTADETRPKALTMLPCIKAYDVISDPNVLNAVGVVNEISRLESGISRLESEKLRKDENINLGVSVPASGTAVDFVGIPEGVKRITVMFDGVRTNGTSHVVAQLGSGSIETSGYVCGAGAVVGTDARASTYTTGFGTYAASAADFRHGCMNISKITDNKWMVDGTINANGTNNAISVAGSKSLSGALGRVRITTLNGTDQFDAGTINISWEF